MLKKILLISTVILLSNAAICQTTKTDPPKLIIADQVVAVVGNSAILYSELEENRIQIMEQRKEQGYTSDRNPLSEALEMLMLQKMLSTQAQIDSLHISTNDIAQIVEDNVQQMIKTRGSAAAVEAYYKKPLFDIKEDFSRKYQEMRYAQRMQQDIYSKVAITPGEVERYFKSISKDSLPIIPEQYVYAQITKYPASIVEAKQRARERLLEMRGRIMNGTQRFEALARMYSVDPSAVQGGEMDPSPKEKFVAPFADALVKLKPNQVSEVVETEFGFHIIQLIDKKDNLYHCRHILIRPEFSINELMETRQQLDSIAVLIKAGTITFEEAALKNSDDKYSKLNGGLVSNIDIMEAYGAMDPKYTSTRFPKDQLPSVDDYKALSVLKPGEMSSAYQSEDIRSNTVSKIVKLIQIIPAHTADLKEDYLQIDELALEAKKRKTFDNWLKNKIEGMYIRINPMFSENDFENKAWFK